jgi:Mor family transcriptional regulator
METIESPAPKRRGAKPKDERNRQMAADYDAGMSLSDLASKYSLKESSVRIMIMQFRRNGLVQRPAPRRSLQNVERNAEIVSLYEAGGITLRQLADKYGMTPVNVGSIVRDHAMRKQASLTEPLVTITIKRTDAERFLKNRPADAEFRGQSGLPYDIVPIYEALKDALSQ